MDKSRYASVVMQTVRKIASFTECDVLILTVINPKRPSKAHPGNDNEENVREFHEELIQRYFPQSEIEIGSKSDHGSNKFIPVRGVTVHSRTVEGEPANTICEWADNVNADLVVVGKRGAGDSSASLLGSVSERVVHKSGRSVLVAIKERSDHAVWEVGSAGIEKSAPTHS